MANTNDKWGLRPLSKLGSGSNSTGVSSYSMYEIASDNTTKLYHGQPVIPLASGYIDAAGAAAGGTVSLLGVFQGCEYISSTTGKPVWSNYWPGSGANSSHAVKAFVCDDPNQLFVIATDATWTSEATARAAVFLNANFTTSITGSDDTGLSYGMLAISTLATTNTLNVRLMGWTEDAANEDFSAAGIGAIVRINNHFNAPTGSIAAGTVSTTGL
jgi:hypothetical protein